MCDLLPSFAVLSSQDVDSYALSLGSWGRVVSKRSCSTHSRKTFLFCFVLRVTCLASTSLHSVYLCGECIVVALETPGSFTTLLQTQYPVVIPTRCSVVAVLCALLPWCRS
ncbi:unnamed protein product [Ectocarpus sp. 12 AP-2014]